MMEAIDDQVGAANDPAGPARQFESAEKYAYYRRCTQLRKNGEQCKGPAMKGETVCYSHFNQAELQRFRHRQRENFLGALMAQAGLGSNTEVGRTVHKINSAFLQGLIDGKTAGRMIRQVQRIIMEMRMRRMKREQG